MVALGGSIICEADKPIALFYSGLVDDEPIPLESVRIGQISKTCYTRQGSITTP